MILINNAWDKIVKNALNHLQDDYLTFLQKETNYFPNKENFLNAFKTLDIENTKYILFGQDPYPREQSAIGYAFIDGDVKNIWDEVNGLSKEVNKATSLRNFIKMLLVCEKKLDENKTSKEAIVKIDKTHYIQTMDELKQNFEKNGVLLLNMALVFTSKDQSKKHIKAWQPFVKSLLEQIKDENIELILFGNIAKEVEKFTVSNEFKKFYCEHPYNVSFIKNKNVQNFFHSMKLLEKC
ncbi:MAG: uracil-DNA glycosylase family protein [Candidatus Marinarcus sp.]|uniref:uracil-DNA glycosylase family protein n=1 Tax=Candidatus Marinarcus sp. TaxID=3100987 RepID=UPI003AFFD2D0